MSLLYGVLMLSCKYRESSEYDVNTSTTRTCCHFYFRRMPHSPNPIEHENATTTTGESISPKEAENMKLSPWKKTRVGLRHAAKLQLNWIAGVIAWCCGFIFVGIYCLWLMPYLMVSYGYSRTLSSIVVSLGFAGSAIGVLGFGEISRRWSHRKPLVFAGVAMYSGIIAVIYVPDLPLEAVIALSIVIGMALGCPIVLFVLGREYNWYYGSGQTATGIINMMQLSSGFIGQYTIGFLLDVHRQQRVPGGEGDDITNMEYTDSDYRFAFIVAPAAVVVMFVMSFALKETNGQNMDYGVNRVNRQSHRLRIPSDISFRIGVPSDIDIAQHIMEKEDSSVIVHGLVPIASHSKWMNSDCSSLPTLDMDDCKE